MAWTYIPAVLNQVKIVSYLNQMKNYLRFKVIPGCPPIQSPAYELINFSFLFKGMGEISSLVPYQKLASLIIPDLDSS
jgi:hypothetical protein